MPHTTAQPEEEWRPVVGNHKYEISSLGRLRNAETSRISKVKPRKDGYVWHSLVGTNSKEKIVKLAHIMVAEAFLPKLDGCNIVNHKDGIKTNNNVANLEYVTASQNTQHAHDNGLFSKPRPPLPKCPPPVDGVPVKDFPSYLVTPDGNVYSTQSENFRNLGLGSYPYVKLSENGKYQQFQVHILVAEAFVPNPENKPWVNHKNGITTDARAENLEWVTPQENAQHAHDTGLNSIGTPVIQLDLEGNVIATFKSQAAAARAMGVSKGTISSCVGGGAPTACGYVWRYADENHVRKESNGRERRVEQLDLDGNPIATFTSILEASRTLKISAANISSCIRELQKTCGGFKWKYAV